MGEAAGVLAGRNSNCHTTVLGHQKRLIHKHFAPEYTLKTLYCATKRTKSALPT